MTDFIHSRIDGSGECLLIILSIRFTVCIKIIQLKMADSDTCYTYTCIVSSVDTKYKS